MALIQFPYTFLSLLAGTSRLVVPTRPYVVRAAPSLTPNPGIGLPSASTGRCDNQRRASQPARSNSASWRTANFVDDDERDSGEPVQLVAEPAPYLGFGQAGDPLGGGSERNSVTAAGCLDPESDGEVFFSGSGWAQEDHVVGFADGRADAGARSELVTLIAGGRSRTLSRVFVWGNLAARMRFSPPCVSWAVTSSARTLINNSRGSHPSARAVLAMSGATCDGDHRNSLILDMPRLVGGRCDDRGGPPGPGGGSDPSEIRRVCCLAGDLSACPPGLGAGLWLRSGCDLIDTPGAQMSSGGSVETGSVCPGGVFTVGGEPPRMLLCFANRVRVGVDPLLISGGELVVVV